MNYLTMMNYLQWAKHLSWGLHMPHSSPHCWFRFDDDCGYIGGINVLLIQRGRRGNVMAGIIIRGQMTESLASCWFGRGILDACATMHPRSTAWFAKTELSGTETIEVSWSFVVFSYQHFHCESNWLSSFGYGQEVLVTTAITLLTTRKHNFTESTSFCAHPYDQKMGAPMLLVDAKAYRGPWYTQSSRSVRKSSSTKSNHTRHCECVAKVPLISISVYIGVPLYCANWGVQTQNFLTHFGVFNVTPLGVLSGPFWIEHFPRGNNFADFVLKFLWFWAQKSKHKGTGCWFFPMTTRWGVLPQRGLNFLAPNATT